MEVNANIADVARCLNSPWGGSVVHIATALEEFIAISGKARSLIFLPKARKGITLGQRSGNWAQVLPSNINSLDFSQHEKIEPRFV